MPRPVSVCITGSSGFIGQHLARRLREEGYQVTGWDQVNTRDGNTSPEVRADLTKDRFDPGAAVCVYHLAAEADLALCEADPQRAFDAMRAALNVFGACAARRVPVVFTSTMQVYGRPQMPSILETHPCVPDSIYAATKLLAERAALLLRERKRAPLAIARLFNVYGPGQEDAITYRSTFLIDKIRQVQERASVPLVGHYATRDFVYVDDVVRGLTAIGTALIGGYAEEIYNIGSGEATTLGEAMTQICTQLDRHPAIEHKPPSPDDIGAGEFPLRADLGRMARIGWKPAFTFELGLAMLIQYLTERDRQREVV